jgi:hypothetical protein
MCWCFYLILISHPPVCVQVWLSRVAQPAQLMGSTNTCAQRRTKHKAGRFTKLKFFLFFTLFGTKRQRGPKAWSKHVSFNNTREYGCQPLNRPLWSTIPEQPVTVTSNLVSTNDLNLTERNHCNASDAIRQAQTAERPGGCKWNAGLGRFSRCHRFIMTWVVDLVPPLSACDDCGSTMNNRRRAHTAGWMFSFYGNAQVLVLPVLGEKKFKRSLFLVFNEYSLCPRINAILAFKLCPSKLATSD